MKKFLSLFFSVIFLLFSTIYVSAAVLINEFSSTSDDDWVELYNDGESDIDLSSYLIRDSLDNSAVNKITLTGVLHPKEIKSFDFSTNALNKSTSDSVRLFQIVNGQEILKDSISYGGTGQVCYPSEQGSLGRYEDGKNLIDRFSTQSKGVTNGNGQKDPCPSPTSAPSDTPKPTNTPTTAPTATKTPTPKPTATKSPTPTEEEESPTPQDNQSEVLGVQTTETESPSPTPLVASQSSSKIPFLAYVFIGGGVITIGASSFLFLKNRKINS